MELRKFIVEEEPEVNSDLKKMGLNKPDLIKVVDESVLGHNNTTAHSPANASGWLAYCAGTTALRDIFCTGNDRWKLDRKDSIESIINEDKKIKIVYQNVDCAADISRDPKARSKKGAGSERAVRTNLQLELFQKYETSTLRVNGTQTWYLCVSIKGPKVHAELSLPESLVNGQFSKFIRRIFILKDDDFSELSISNIDLDIGPDCEVNVARK